MTNKITLKDIENNIDDIEIVKHITKSGKILRWAVLTTDNGYAVVGRPSATVDQANDIVEIGERLAIENSKREMWHLMGYELASKLKEVEACKLSSNLTDYGYIVKTKQKQGIGGQEANSNSEVKLEIRTKRGKILGVSYLLYKELIAHKVEDYFGWFCNNFEYEYMDEIGNMNFYDDDGYLVAQFIRDDS